MLMLILYIVAGLIALIILFFVLAAVLGSSIPKDHIIRGEITLTASPERVFAVLDDIATYPAWSKNTSVEKLPDRDARPTWRFRQGRNAFIITIPERTPPTLLKHVIADENQFFSGSWTMDLIPTGSGTSPGTKLTLTEHGTINAAIPRFFMKYFADPGMYLKAHLSGLAKHLGDSTVPTSARIS